VKEINPRLKKGDFIHPPIKVFHNGFEDTIKIRNNLEVRKASGENCIVVFQ